MQETLASGEAPFPSIEVRSVFFDLETHSGALIQLAPLDQPDGTLQDFASGFAFTFPFPMVLEQGEWRLGLPILTMAPEEGCPFDVGRGEAVPVQARQIEATPQPPFPRLSPPPGVRLVGGSSGGGRGEYNASVLLETNMTLVDLFEYYRQRVLQPGWKVQQETMDEDLAAISWTLRDEEDQPWFGVLLITPAEEGTWVRLWMGGGAGVQTFVFQDGREIRVPTPAKRK